MSARMAKTRHFLASVGIYQKLPWPQYACILFQEKCMWRMTPHCIYICQFTQATELHHSRHLSAIPAFTNSCNSSREELRRRPYNNDAATLQNLVLAFRTPQAHQLRVHSTATAKPTLALINGHRSKETWSRATPFVTQDHCTGWCRRIVSVHHLLPTPKGKITAAVLSKYI